MTDGPKHFGIKPVDGEVIVDFDASVVPIALARARRLELPKPSAAPAIPPLPSAPPPQSFMPAATTVAPEPPLPPTPELEPESAPSPRVVFQVQATPLAEPFDLTPSVDPTPIPEPEPTPEPDPEPTADLAIEVEDNDIPTPPDIAALYKNLGLKPPPGFGKADDDLDNGTPDSDLVVEEPEPDDDQAPVEFHAELVVEEKPRAETPNLPARPGHMLQRLNNADDEGSRAAGRLGDRLIARGWLDPEQLKVALQEKKTSGKMLGEVLVDLGFITDAQLSEVLAEAAGIEVFDVKNTIFDGEALELLTKDQAQKMQVLPVAKIDGELMVAMVDPHDIVALDRLRRIVPRGMVVRPLLTTPSVMAEAIDAAYGYSSDVESILAEMEGLDPETLARVPDSGTYTHPVVRLVNTLVAEAVKQGISDLHWEPEENFVRLRYRLDGVLFTAQIIHKKHWSPIAQRIKIMAGMNIADKLSPQDGRFELKFGPRSADFRVSVLPTVFGENIVMRVLDRTASILPLEKLGFSPINLEKIQWAQTRPEGIIIVTGPTGSGKSTSLYSMINAINSVQVNIQTLEDPVEYSLPMIRQTPVREGVLEFADGIRAMLRQDPDIIFIGEIRDGVTAEMALKAAMTGHQVYTTLHTNDSFGAIPRLLDLGLKPGMIAGAIIAVFAQRLARRLCTNCREQYTPDAHECKLLGFDPVNPPSIYRARAGGCQMCRGQGYKGRIALAEILTFDEELDEIIARNGTKGELRKKAIEKGFKSMKDDAILKIREGITSFESAATCVDFTR